MGPLNRPEANRPAEDAADGRRTLRGRPKAQRAVASRSQRTTVALAEMADSARSGAEEKSREPGSVGTRDPGLSRHNRAPGREIPEPTTARRVNARRHITVGPSGFQPGGVYLQHAQALTVFLHRDHSARVPLGEGVLGGMTAPPPGATAKPEHRKDQDAPEEHPQERVDRHQAPSPRCPRFRSPSSTLPSTSFIESTGSSRPLFSNRSHVPESRP